MKTKQIYYIAAMAMLTACTSSEEYETVTNNGLQKVTFTDPFVGKNLTRAESGDIDNTSLTSFKIRVWGQEVDNPDNGTLSETNAKPYTNSKEEVPFYNGDDITYSSGWVPVDGKEYYYPRDKYNFRFAAFAPAEAINDASLNPNGVSLAIKADGSLTFRGTDDNSAGITNIPLVQEIDNTADAKKGWDLLVSNRFLSTPTNGVTDREAISFTFQHILSKLSFYVYASQTEGKKFYVKSINAYLPKDNWTGSYKQNDKTANPMAELLTANGEVNAKTWYSTINDTWAWENRSGTTTAFTNIADVVTPSDFENKIVTPAKSDATTPNSYKEYEVFTKKSTDDKGDEVTLTAYNTTPSSGTDNITCKSYFLAPTPAAEGNVEEYNFYVKIEYTVEETTDGNTTTKNYIGYLDLSKSDFKRFRQGWHHKVYIGLAHKTIRFISASVDEWDGEHKEDMTVSREVDGWTAEQN